MSLEELEDEVVLPRLSEWEGNGMAKSSLVEHVGSHDPNFIPAILDVKTNQNFGSSPERPVKHNLGCGLYIGSFGRGKEVDATRTRGGG